VAFREERVLHLSTGYEADRTRPPSSPLQAGASEVRSDVEHALLDAGGDLGAGGDPALNHVLDLRRDLLDLSR
jgi:hypothetical protein